MTSVADAVAQAPSARAGMHAARRAARTAQLLEAPIAPTLARLSAPNVLAMFVTSSTSIAEAYFAGLLGVSALAGVALVFPFMMLTQMLAAGSMGGAVSSSVARALGAGHVDRAERLILHALVIATVAALGSALLIAIFGAAVFGLLGGRGEALQGALAYAFVFFPGCIFVWWCHTLLSVVRGTGNMVVPALVLLVASLASIPLSGALALGWGPFPQLGMAGLAFGIVAVYALGTVVSLIYIGAGFTGLSLRNALGPLQWALFWDILRVGIIASLSAIQTIFTTVVMVGLIGSFGEGALAGYGLGTRVEFLMIPVVFGIGASMTAMVGANIGASQRQRALQIAWTGSLAAAAIVGVIGLLFAFYPDLWLGLFLKPGEDAAARSVGHSYFHMVAPFYAFQAVGQALYFASQGAGRVVWPVIAGFLRMAVAVGGGLVLLHWTAFGLEGVFAAVVAGIVVYGVTTVAAVKRTGWQ